jgi:type IV pilus assembly protein PilB
VEDVDAVELEQMGFSKGEIPTLRLYGPRGCLKCKSVGYKGRVGLFELMAVNEEIAKAINAGASEDHLRRIASKEGMVTLREAGLEKIRRGITSAEEVLKCTVATKEMLPSYLLKPDLEQYEDRSVIVREGTHDKDFFSLVQGALLVVKKGKKIGEIKEPGEFFGEMAAITGQVRSTTIISNGRSTVKRFPGDKLSEIIEQYPDVTKKLFEITANRLHRAELQIVELLRDAMGRQRDNGVISIKERRSGFER